MDQLSRGRRPGRYRHIGITKLVPMPDPRQSVQSPNEHIPEFALHVDVNIWPLQLQAVWPTRSATDDGLVSQIVTIQQRDCYCLTGVWSAKPTLLYGAYENDHFDAIISCDDFHHEGKSDCSKSQSIREQWQKHLKENQKHSIVCGFEKKDTVNNGARHLS